MFHKIKIFKKESKIKREYSYEEMLQIQRKKRRKEMALAIIISLSIIFYLAWLESSPITEVRSEVRILGEKLMDIHLKVIQARNSATLTLDEERNWLVKEHSPEKPCEASKGGNLFFENTKDIAWKFFLAGKNLETRKKEIHSFCLDSKGSVNLMEESSEDVYLFSIVAHLKKESTLEPLQEILFQGKQFSIRIRDY